MKQKDDCHFIVHPSASSLHSICLMLRHGASSYLFTMRILLATNNPHKAEELVAILNGLDGLEILTLKDLPFSIPEPVEDGDTLEANAYIKAREIFAATGIPTVADDTGLEVDALNGAPGVFSARYAGEGATYGDNCTRLLGELAGVPESERTARFRTVVCYIDPLRTLFAEGIIEGAIADAARGSSGFGYDPLFQPGDDPRTFAEMTSEEKNRVSHRARALAALRQTLSLYLAEGVDG
jgi:XTP/dITP diphosphohydrolase